MIRFSHQSLVVEKRERCERKDHLRLVSFDLVDLESEGGKVWVNLIEVLVVESCSVGLDEVFDRVLRRVE